MVKLTPREVSSGPKPADDEQRIHAPAVEGARVNPPPGDPLQAGDRAASHGPSAGQERLIPAVLRGQAPRNTGEAAPDATGAGSELQLLMIGIRNLLFKRGDRIILKDINLDIASGAFVAIVGMSGCGKSTLLRLIGGLERPNQGQIWVGGNDIVPMRERELQRTRQNMGFVFQGAALFDYLTVYENVAFGLRRSAPRVIEESEIKQRVADRLSLMGLEGTENRLPGELSGGMQKRVGLARAIAVDPPPQILLYDEPTSGLDPIMTAVTNDLILRVRDELGVTSVVVTHDMGTLHLADQVAMIHDGIIEAVGTPDELAHTTNPIVDQFVHGRATGPIDVAGSGVEL